MKTNKKKPREKGSDPKKDARRKAADDRAYDLANLTAAAWVSAIRFRVKGLAAALGSLDCIKSHPDEGAAALILKTVIDRAALGQLIGAVDQAEAAVDELLDEDVCSSVPDLAGACREAGAALLASTKATEAKS